MQNLAWGAALVGDGMIFEEGILGEPARVTQAAFDSLRVMTGSQTFVLTCPTNFTGDMVLPDGTVTKWANGVRQFDADNRVDGDGEIRATLIVNHKRGTFGEWELDESQSTLRILVQVLEQLIKAAQPEVKNAELLSGPPGDAIVKLGADFTGTIHLPDGRIDHWRRGEHYGPSPFYKMLESMGVPPGVFRADLEDKWPEQLSDLQSGAVWATTTMNIPEQLRALTANADQPAASDDDDLPSPTYVETP